MTRRTKWIVRSVALVVVIATVSLVHGFWKAWSRFANEEKICGAFHPVINALRYFQEKTGTPPTNLTQLVPGYLQKIPAAPITNVIEYQVLADGTNWQLSVRSSVRGKPELFVQRLYRDYSAQELSNSVTGFHGWLVFTAR